MDINFQAVSKRFAYEWIFKKLDYTIDSGDHLGIIGPNGSGKSTLLRVLLGTIDPSQGKVSYSINKKKLPVVEVFQHISFAAPYMGIPDNLTIQESLRFHFKFRSLLEGLTIDEIPELAYLSNNKHKLIRQYSSGMQQRYKLALSICTHSNILVLDEPTTNLDDQGKEWFHDMISRYLGDRTLIIATNEKEDLKMCSKFLNILDYK